MTFPMAQELTGERIDRRKETSIFYTTSPALSKQIASITWSSKSSL
jgi:hypothetical protein